MTRPDRYLLFAAAGACLAACVAAPPAAEPDEVRPSAYIGPLDRVEPIAPAEPDDAAPTIEQLASSQESQSVTFAPLEANDPCLGATTDLPQCQAAQLRQGTTREISDGPAPEERLQSYGLEADFDMDDPSSVVDEIGRGRPMSQTAQALGSDFLAPPTTEPIEDEDDAAGQFDPESLPPGILVQPPTGG